MRRVSEHSRTSARLADPLPEDCPVGLHGCGSFARDVYYEPLAEVVER